MKLLVVTDKCDRAESGLFIRLNKTLDLTVICNPEGRNHARLVQAHVHCIDLKLRGRFDRNGTRKIKHELYAGDYDIVHAFNSRALACAIRAGKRHRAKILGYRGVTTNVSYHQPENWWTFLNPRLDGIFCVADAVRVALLNAGCRYLHIPATRLRTIYKGHEPEWYQGKTADLSQYGVPDDARTICCISRNSNHKGVPKLLDAFDQLDANLNVHLVLIGGINKNKSAHARAGQCRYPERVHFTGYSDNVPGIVSSSDLLVSASQSGEGLPRVVVEAMCVKCPVVATDAGGTSEIVHDQITGLLIEQGNAGQLANAIHQVFNHPEAARRRADNALARIYLDFNADQTAEQTLAWYNELLQA